MDTALDFVSGPLFRMSLAVCVLGLGFRVVAVVSQVVGAWRRAGDRRLPLAAVATATLSWLFPRRLLNQRPVTSVASFLFHLGLVVAPLVLAGHVALLSSVLPAAWPVLPPAAADALTVIALVAILILIGARLVVAEARVLTRRQDLLLLVLLWVVAATGFDAAHPLLTPLPAQGSLLAHMLAGNLVLVLMPFTKISHCVLFPFAQLAFELGWHFPADSGRHVGVALGKEGEL